MTSKGCVAHLLKLLIISFPITLCSIFYSATGLEHTSHWKPETPQWHSDYEVVTKWGFLFGIVIDNPYAGLKNRMDRKDSLAEDALIIDWILWFVLATMIYFSFMASVLLFQSQRNGR